MICLQIGAAVNPRPCLRENLLGETASHMTTADLSEAIRLSVQEAMAKETSVLVDLLIGNSVVTHKIGTLHGGIVQVMEEFDLFPYKLTRLIVIDLPKA